MSSDYRNHWRMLNYFPMKRFFIKFYIFYFHSVKFV